MKPALKWLRHSICVFLFISLNMQSSEQEIVINKDETKVPPYVLPDPLLRADGKRITNSKQWLQTQRPVMLKLFADNVYGRMPGKPKNIRFQVSSVDSNALAGAAIRKQVTIFFNKGESAPSMDLLLYMPKSAKKSVPVFVGLNFYGNQTINKDNGIRISSRWVMNDEK